jgi:hypothetical protein
MDSTAERMRLAILAAAKVAKNPMLLGDVRKPCINIGRRCFGQSFSGFAMLDALLIAGLMTAIATPALVLIIEVLKRRFAAVPNLRPHAASSSLPETLPMPEDLPKLSSDTSTNKIADDEFDADSKASENGFVHEIPVNVSDFVIPAFLPGTDRCRVSLRSPEVKFDIRAGATGTVLEFHDVQERLTITFLGLNRLPTEDIETEFVCPDRGRQVQPLPDLGVRDVAKVSAEEINDAEWRLAAWAETERAVEAFDNPVHARANEERSTLLPKFAGFDAEAECIEVWIPSVSECNFQVEVVPTQDGHHGLVLIAGRPTALLQGAPTASVRNIQFVPMTAKAA